MSSGMKGRREHVAELRAKDRTMLENVAAFDEIYSSGGLSYRLVRDWAKLPPEIKDYEIAGVCYGRNGCLYVSTRAPGYPIAVFSPEGEWLRYIGRGTPVSFPHGIYVDAAENVWLADGEGHAAYQWDSSGRPGRILEQLNRPTRVVCAPDGDLYISDEDGNHHVSSEGISLCFRCGAGDWPEHFGAIHSLWIDAQGRLLAADRNADRVLVFDGSGRLMKTLDGLLDPTDIASDESFLYVAEREGRVSIFNYELERVAQIGYWLSPMIPHGIAVDPQGNLYLSQLWGNYSLIKLERQGDT